MRSRKTITKRTGDPSFHSESHLTLLVWTEKEKLVENIPKSKNELWETWYQASLERDGFKKGEMIYIPNARERHTSDH